MLLDEATPLDPDSLAKLLPDLLGGVVITEAEHAVLAAAGLGSRTWHNDEIRVLVAYHHPYGPRGGGRTNLRPLCRLFGLSDDEVNKLEP